MWIYINLPISDFQDVSFPEFKSPINQTQLFTLQINPSFSLTGIKSLFVRVRIIQGAIITIHIFSSCYSRVKSPCNFRVFSTLFCLYSPGSETRAKIPHRPGIPFEKSCQFYSMEVVITLWVPDSGPTLPASCSPFCPDPKSWPLPSAVQTLLRAALIFPSWQRCARAKVNARELSF